jgi:SAM-dependent methyltransferase
MTVAAPSDGRLVELPCPVCSGEEYRVYLPATLDAEPPVFGYKWTPAVRRSYRMVACRSCGHVRASPRLADMHKYYVDNVDDAYVANQPLRTATARRVLQTVRKFKPTGRLLDVGCATGDFVKVAAKYYDAEGLELSAWAREIALAKGLRVRSKLLSDIETERDTYDVVTLWGVIEHLEHPLEEMKRVQAILKPGGIVCLWTGDVDSLLARVFGSRWWYVMGQHIQLFSRSSLDNLLRQAGFEALYRGVYPYEITLGYLGDSLGRYPALGPLARSLLNLSMLKHLTFTLKLPDEIFDIYGKKSS